MSNPLTLAKFAAHILASLSVGKVIEDVIKNNTTIVTRSDQVRVTVGGFILGSMIVDKAANQLSTHWDAAVKMFKDVKEQEEDKENATQEIT